MYITREMIKNNRQKITRLYHIATTKIDDSEAPIEEFLKRIKNAATLAYNNFLADVENGDATYLINPEEDVTKLLPTMDLHYDDDDYTQHVETYIRYKSEETDNEVEKRLRQEAQKKENDKEAECRRVEYARKLEEKERDELARLKEKYELKD